MPRLRRCKRRRGNLGLSDSIGVAHDFVILAATLLVLVWGLAKNGYGNEYYAAAVRSMTYSWRNFVYGAADPGGWITTDKPPLRPVARRPRPARVFGFLELVHPVAISGLRRGVGGAGNGGRAPSLGQVGGASSRSNAGADAELCGCSDTSTTRHRARALYGRCRVCDATAKRPPTGMDDRRRILLRVGIPRKALVVGFVMPGIFAAYLLAGPGGWWRGFRDSAVAGERSCS